MSRGVVMMVMVMVVRGARLGVRLGQRRSRLGDRDRIGRRGFGSGGRWGWRQRLRSDLRGGRRGSDRRRGRRPAPPVQRHERHDRKQRDPRHYRHWMATSRAPQPSERTRRGREMRRRFNQRRGDGDGLELITLVQPAPNRLRELRVPHVLSGHPVLIFHRLNYVSALTRLIR
jgi:hypothetical protein